MRVNLVNPGPVRTAARQGVSRAKTRSTLPTPEELVPLFLEFASPSATCNGRIVKLPRLAEANAAGRSATDASRRAQSNSMTMPS